MSYKRSTSNILTLALAGFFALCGQAHLTNKFTPGFAAVVENSLEPLNEKAFWFLGVTPATLNHMLLAINILLVSLLLPPATRKAGLGASVFFLSLGFYGDIATGDPVTPHIVLISSAMTALLLR